MKPDFTQTAHAADDIHAQDRTVGDLANASAVPAQSTTLPASQLPGEGVGLSIVRRLCELLDASLEMETSPGAGSTFQAGGATALRQQQHEIKESGFTPW